MGAGGRETTYSGKDIEGPDDIERLESREKNLDEGEVRQFGGTKIGERGPSTIPMERALSRSRARLTGDPHASSIRV